MNSPDTSKHSTLIKGLRIALVLIISLAVAAILSVLGVVATVLTLLFVPTLYLITAEVTALLRHLFGLSPASIEPSGKAE